MNQFRFEADIAFAEGVPTDVVSQRVYGRVRVSAQWPNPLALPVTRVALEVRGDVGPRDAAPYVELFFHDVFLLLNLASPGSFGGTISITGDALRVRELDFDARLFTYAAPLETLPVTSVIAWYDTLKLGVQQVATSGVAIALVQLLQLARGPEREEDSIIRLAIAAESLGVNVSARLFELRDHIARGRGPIIHPMHDDALDPRVEDATREWLEVADAAAHVVIRALQQRVKN
ncbi:MAG TPA: hypothetical protein VHW00_09400 [Thermoanaerobaculia bacterium]|nr:hypothetical protein [Thermoanaerobaculia bacterium]